jgi:hypothetical protein
MGRDALTGSEFMSNDNLEPSLFVMATTGPPAGEAVC